MERIAPHLTRQTPFVIPAKTASVAAKLRAGLWAFEKLGGVPKSRRHEVWSAAQVREREPAIGADDLAGAVVYPEYLTDDARLTLANVRSASASGAQVINYAPVRSLLIEDGRAVGVTIGDGSSMRPRSPGARTGDRQRRRPWVDEVRAMESARRRG